MSDYILRKECANCFTQVPEEVTMCPGCGELLTTKISQQDESFKERYQQHVKEKFANAEKPNYSIEDLE